MQLMINLISLARAPLALVFLQHEMPLRLFGIIMAMITDGLDGYLARKYNACSQFGAFLDPLMDKLFMICALSAFFVEGSISLPEIGAMMCRDFSVMFFGFYLVIKGTWSKYKFRSIWCGKVTTALQLLVLIALTIKVPLPGYVFTSFIVLGALALVELYISHLQLQSAKETD